MKSYLKLVPVLLLLVFGAVVSESAMARGGHGGGGHGGGHGGGYSRGYGYGGGVALGLALAAPLYGLSYYGNPYYSYPYPAPAYAYPDPAYAYQGPAAAPPARYVEQGVPQAAPPPPPTQAQPQPQGEWYFCPSSNTYYPYVRECPGGWQRVPAQPPR
jgi:hypothetical protein